MFVFFESENGERRQIHVGLAYPVKSLALKAAILDSRERDGRCVIVNKPPCMHGWIVTLMMIFMRARILSSLLVRRVIPYVLFSFLSVAAVT